MIAPDNSPPVVGSFPTRVSSGRSGTLTGHGVRATGGRDAPCGATVAGVRRGRDGARGSMARARAGGPRGVPGAGRLQRDRRRELPPGSPAASGTSRAPATRASRASRPTSASTGDAGQLQDQHAGHALPDRHLPHGLLRRRRRPQGRDDQPDAACRRTSRPASRTRRPAWSTAATGPCPRPGRCRPRPCRASTSPTSCATDAGRGEPHLLRRAQRRLRVGHLFQTSDTTWQAYNDYGGNSLYEGGPRAGATARQGQLQPAVRHRAATRAARTGSSTPSTRWSAGWSATATTCSYKTGVDTDRRGRRSATTRSSCRSATTSTGPARSAPTSRPRATRASTSPSSAATRCSGRPAGRRASTARTPRTARSSPTRRRTRTRKSTRHARAGRARGATRARSTPRGGRPENALTGTIFTVNAGTRAIRVPADAGKLRFWRNTQRRQLSRRGDDATLADGTLGYEWDSDLDNGVAPARARRPVLDHRERRRTSCRTTARPTATGSATHSLTLYRAARRRARLRRRHRPVVLGARRQRTTAARSTADPRMQQATVNLFADMHGQPGTLRSEPDRGLGLHRHTRRRRRRSSRRRRARRSPPARR